MMLGDVSLRHVDRLLLLELLALLTSPSLGSLQNLKETVDSGRRGNLAIEDLLNGDLPTVEHGVGVLALGDDGAVDLDTSIKAARLDVAVDGLFDGLDEGTGLAVLVGFLAGVVWVVRVVVRINGRVGELGVIRGQDGLAIGGCWPRRRLSILALALIRLLSLWHAPVQSTTSAPWARGNSQVATETETGAGESLEGLLGVDDDHAVVDIQTDDEAGANAVNVDTGWRRPSAVGESGDQNTRAAGARDLEPGADGGEDGQALGLGNDLGRNGEENTRLFLGSGSINGLCLDGGVGGGFSGGRFDLVGDGEGGLRRGSRWSCVAVDAVLWKRYG